MIVGIFDGDDADPFAELAVAAGSHDPIERGQKTVDERPFEGPSINPDTGAYVPFVPFEGPNINPVTGAYVAPSGADLIVNAVANRPSSSTSATTLRPNAPAPFPWGPVAAGVVAVGLVGYFVLRRRR